MVHINWEMGIIGGTEMNRFDIINKIGDKYRVGNTESGEFSYVQALKMVGKDIKDYQKATLGTQH